MFSALRQGALFYVLNKGEKPVLKVGQVQSVGLPVPRFGTAQAYGGNPLETVVDISVKVGDEVMEFKQLPSSQSIANFGTNGVVVSESRDAMNGEVEAMQRASRAALDSVDFHKSVLESCECILKELNPQFAKEKEQEKKIGTLESKVTGIESTLDDMMKLLTKALDSKE